MSCATILPGNVIVVLNFPEAMRITIAVVFKWTITNPALSCRMMCILILLCHLQWSNGFQVLSDLHKFLFQPLKEHIHAILSSVQLLTPNMAIRADDNIREGTRDMFRCLDGTGVCVGVGAGCWFNDGLGVGINYVRNFHFVLKMSKLYIWNIPSFFVDLREHSVTGWGINSSTVN